VARRLCRLDNRPEFRVRNWRSPGWAGDLKGVQERRPLNPAPGSRRRSKLEAARALAGRRSFSSSKRLRVRPAFSAPDHNESHCEPDSGPNVRTAGATDSKDDRKSGSR